MTEQEAIELLRKWKEGKCSPDELAILEKWFDDLDVHAPAALTEKEYDLVQARIWDRLNARQPEYTGGRKSVMISWRVAAAAIFILVSSFAYFFFGQSPDRHPELVSGSPDIPAGTNKATLTLANGKRINLDDTKNGAITNQGGITVSKNKNGQIVYSATSPQGDPGLRLDDVNGRDNDKGAAVVIAYNTISTPNGGQYQVILPDGSNVYLNAASSLKYPVKFVEKERKVTLTGEGYFEITKNPAQPFIVISNNQIVTVLGTHFNISNYPEEAIKTTLAEGKVRISLSNKTSLNSPSETLKPGEQAINKGGSLQLKTVNLETELAWTKGRFIFDQSGMKSVLQQISRWYDVEIDYDNIPDKQLYGAISRDVPLSELLKMIEITSHVKLKLEGRRITIQQ